MKRELFEKELRKKISQVTFSGHRVNDDYSLNKRKAIVAVVLSAFDEAAKQDVQVTGICPFCEEPIATEHAHEFCYPPVSIIEVGE